MKKIQFGTDNKPQLMGWLGRLRPAGAAVTLNVVFPRIGISLMGRPPRQFHGLVEVMSAFLWRRFTTSQEAVIEVEVAMEK